MRIPEAQDLDTWADMLGDDGARFIGGPMSRAEAWRTLAMMVGHWELRDFGQFSVVERQTGICIGRVGAWMPEGWPGTEIGWALLRKYQGAGYAVEAAEAAFRWAFEELGWSEVIHCIHPDNEKSKATANRLGSTFLRMTRLPRPLDETETEIFGQSREMWQAKTTHS
ncbi:MAG: GNAT family N-acetyltransferase [Novosphingobium sp.]|nr:GNAT family N-acetyltransferase [Novosphingobium sp.]